ncbi:hypothetical protein CCR75_009515 [Bremia lactucae]|uniref:Secreted RxLR effector n=1 Tax=Bremia lactucae TaxID=4779 RepID=A0A976IFB6_BRELC|nr:hypothetical protein CCR75_009515 [Bremia lactucae]
MVRVYVTALTAFLAFSASVSSTSKLARANPRPVNTDHSDAPAQLRLRGYTATNVETDERVVLTEIYAFVRKFMNPLSLPTEEMVAIVNCVKDLNTPVKEVLRSAELQHLSDLVKSYNRRNREYPASLYALLEFKYGAINLAEAMETAKIEIGNIGVIKQLLKEQKEHWKDWTEDGVDFAKELEIGKDDYKAFQNGKIKELQAFIQDKTQAGSDEILLSVLLSEFDGDAKLAIALAKAYANGKSQYILDIIETLGLKWRLDQLTLDKAWFKVCGRGEMSVDESKDRINMFSHLYGISLRPTKKKTTSAEYGSTLVEMNLLTAYKENNNDVALNVLIHIRLARWLPKSYPTYNQLGLQNLSLQDVLCSLASRYTTHKRATTNKKLWRSSETFVDQLRMIFPDDITLARTLVEVYSGSSENHSVLSMLKNELYDVWIKNKRTPETLSSHLVRKDATDRIILTGYEIRLVQKMSERHDQGPVL